MSRLILLTGCTGFVGQHVLADLHRRGVSTRVVVREGSQLKVRSSPFVESIITSPDIFSETSQWWERVCEGVDTVIHVAWYAEPGQYLQSEKNVDCLRGSLDLAKGAMLAKVHRFVGVGTCFEYDLSSGVLYENTELRPQSPYAAAKAALFTMLSQWLPSQQTEFAWCRLFYLYGKGEDEKRLVPYLHARLAAGESANLTSGKQIRDFLDVHDASSMLVEAALSDQQGAINVCSGIPITVRQLAEQIADEYGRRDLLKFGARPDNRVDPTCVIGIRHSQ